MATTAQANAQSAQIGFEIGDLDSVTDVNVTHKVVVLENDDGEPVSGFFIVGKNSKEFQAASNTIRKESFKRSAKRSSQIDSSTDEGAALLTKVIAANERTLAIAVVVGWFGFNLEGQPMSFDAAILPKMFDKYPTWQAQINAALDNERNFMKV
jgi:hypothetical protein